MKTTIHADGKLGLEDPGERAKAGFLQMAAAADDAKALHEILPYAISLFEELEACRALYAGVERIAMTFGSIWVMRLQTKYAGRRDSVGMASDA
jgi:hypothetical protein